MAVYFGWLILGVVVVMGLAVERVGRAERAARPRRAGVSAEIRAKRFGRGRSPRWGARSDERRPHSGDRAPVNSMTTTANSAKVRMWTAVHHRQIASTRNSSTHTRYSTETMPTAAAASRTRRTFGLVARQNTGRHSAVIATKKSSPSSATGTPSTLEWLLVVTFRQLIAPLSEQASVRDA